ncbi:MAG: TrkA C-terminal domain-containing protein [Candidatus Bathyarchaeota archaeon]
MGEDRPLFERICNDLVELKDTSEMMMDLAYSALLLNSRYLAEEVLLLEDKVDKLHTEFELLVLSSRDEAEEARGLLGLIRMGVVTERIADAAAEIAEVVLWGREPHPILGMVIQDAEETVERATVGESSSLVGKTLKQARIPEETGMWVLVIKRGNRWKRPRPGTILEEGDTVIASGYAEGGEDFQRLISGNGESEK